jgi:hypothetical protein
VSEAEITRARRKPISYRQLNDIQHEKQAAKEWLKMKNLQNIY